jgi:hypothetical protein
MFRCRGQLPQEPRSRRERHLPLGFVADDCKRVLRRRTGARLGEKTALTAPRLADDDRHSRSDPASVDDLGQRLQLIRSADERPHITPLRSVGASSCPAK